MSAHVRTAFALAAQIQPLAEGQRCHLDPSLHPAHPILGFLDDVPPCPIGVMSSKNTPLRNAHVGSHSNTSRATTAACSGRRGANLDRKTRFVLFSHQPFPVLAESCRRGSHAPSRGMAAIVSVLNLVASSPQSGGSTSVCVGPACSLLNTYQDTSNCGLFFLPV